jgi:hypothetical protein
MYIGLLALMLFSNVANAQTWGVKLTPQNISDTIRGTRAIQTSSGYAIVGYYKNTSTGNYDFLLIQLDLNGNLVYAYKYDFLDKDYIGNVFIKSDTLYLLGGTVNVNQDTCKGTFPFIMAVNSSNGNVIWADTLNGRSSDPGTCIPYPYEPCKVQVGYNLPSGDIMILGEFKGRGHIPQDTILFDPFIAVIQGSTLKSFKRLFFYTYDPLGPYFGFFKGNIYFGSSIFAIPGGAYVNDFRRWDMFILRFDNNANPLSTYIYYTQDAFGERRCREVFLDLIILSNGNYITTGQTWGNFCNVWGSPIYFIMKIKSDGNPLVVWKINNVSSISKILYLPNNQAFLVAGKTSTDLEFLARMDTSGNLSYIRTINLVGSRDFIMLTNDGYLLSIINSGNSIYVIKSDTLGNVNNNCQTQSFSTTVSNLSLPIFNSTFPDTVSQNANLFPVNVTKLNANIASNASCYPTPVNISEINYKIIGNYIIFNRPVEYAVFKVNGELIRRSYGDRIYLRRGLYILKYEGRVEKALVK